jgi:uncharacterized protein YcbK (DUF882 family)
MRARIVLTLIVAAASFVAFTPAAHVESAIGQVSPFRFTGDGRILVTDTHTGETLSIVYRASDGTYEDAALLAIDQTLRCHGDNEKFPISLKLVELIDHIQDHFGADRVYVVSGYRSAEYNERIRHTNARVAHNSLHIQGMAMDVRLPDVNKAELAKYARSLRSGGVGLYASSSFVHVDVGPVKNW